MERRSRFASCLLACTFLFTIASEAGAEPRGSPLVGEHAEAATDGARAKRPRLVVQLGHSRNVLCVAYSPDGRTALTGSDDQTARLWDTTTGKEIRCFEGHTDVVNAVAISPDARQVLTGSSDSTARLWDLATGSEIRRFENFAAVSSLAFSPDGMQVLTGGADNRARMWDAQTGGPLRSFEGHADSVLAVAFSRDGKQTLTGSADKTACLWDSQSAALLRRLEGHSDEVTSVAISADGKSILTGSIDQTARLWDAQTAAEVRLFQARRRVFSVAFSPDGQQVVTANEGIPIRGEEPADEHNTVRLWDAQSGDQVRSFRDYGSSASSVAFSPDGKQVLVGAVGNEGFFGTADGRAQLWDVETGSQLRIFQGQRISSVRGIAFSADGGWLLIGGDDDIARLWDLAAGREIHRFSHDPGGVAAVALSADGRMALTGGNDGIVRLWDTASGNEVRRFEGHSGSVVSVALSPNRRWVLTGSEDSTARLWDAATGKETRRLAEYTGETEFVTPLRCAVAFSPDGRSMLTGQWDHTARLWDTASGKELRRFEGHSHMVLSVAFSADGKRVLTGSYDKTARLWDAETGEELRTFRQSGSVTSVALSPDGNRVLTSTWDKMAHLWDAQTGEELQSFTGNSNLGQSVAFSPDGKRAIRAAVDKTAALWDVQTGRPVCTLISCAGGTLAVTPEGNYMAPKAALASVAFGIGNRALPFDQFDLKFNRPDIVLARVGLAPDELVKAYRNAYQKRLDKLGFTEEMLGDDFHLPETAIVSKNPFFTPAKTLKLKVRASDSQRLLDRLNVVVNGVPVHGAGEIGLRALNVKAWEQEVEIELSAGRNAIQISALNDQGVESLKEALEIRCDAPGPPPELYVVAVGVSDYRDRRHRLTYAHKDASDFATFLQSQAARFAKVHVSLILNQKATRESILKTKSLLEKSKVDDQVVVFFAGHGLLDAKSNYYFATPDTDFENPAKRGLSYDAIEGLLDGIRARKKLLLMDTCHSGEVDKDAIETAAIGPLPQGEIKTRGSRGLSRLSGSGPGPNNSRLLEEIFADLRRGTGAVVVSAAGGAEYALESADWGNGVFTYALLEGLKTAKADADRDGRIQVSELRDYVMEAVRRMTRGRQVPTARRENLDVDFPLY